MQRALTRVFSVAGVLSGLCVQALAQVPVPAWSLEAQNRLRPAALGVGATEERARLLREGELALSRLQLPQAQELFDRAALMLHAADAEIALVRTYMQAGEYRRALAFGAHAAGAHRDQPAALALYALLLQLGGQGTAARWQLEQAMSTAVLGAPALWVETRAQLDQAWPVLPNAPAGERFAPYGAPAGPTPLPMLRVAGSATLLPGGRAALAPLAALTPLAPLAHSPDGLSVVGLRNGLGQASAARVVQRWPALGLVLLELADALPFPADLQAAGHLPFAGSPGTMVEFDASDGDVPAWPMLRQGFFARSNPGQPRPLGLTAAPGPRGGPVFDRAGRWVGTALVDATGRPLLLATADLPEGLLPTPLPQTDTPATMPEAEVYERALRTTLQLIVPR